MKVSVPTFESRFAECGEIQATESVMVREFVSLRLQENSDTVNQCVFMKVDSRYALYEVTKTEPYTYDSEESHWKEVLDYQQVPISHSV